MKKIYSSVGVLSTLLLSAFAFGQQNKITEAQIKPVFEKLEVLGKQNPMGAVPLDKLSKEELALYHNYRIQKQEEKSNPYGITEKELKTKIPRSAVQPILDKIKSLESALAFPDDKFTNQELRLLRIYELQNIPKSNLNEKLLNKAYVKDGRQATKSFGTMPLTPPHTVSVISSITNNIYCDDIAGNGKLYAVDSDAKNLVRVTPTGTLVTVGPLGAAVGTGTVSGLSWNASNSKMYVLTTDYKLCTVDMTTGASTLVATVTGMATGALPIWLEIDNAGNAYSADITTDNLYKIDLATGVSTLVGPLGINISFAQDADFNKETNELYMAGYTGGGTGGIYKVNLTTGATTLVGSTTPNNEEYTMFSIADSIDPPLNKAFVKNSYPTPMNFSTIPLTPPHTPTVLGPLTKSIFADDLAGDGNLYGLDDTSKTLVKIYNDGSVRLVGSLVNVPATDVVTGLSWNRANNTMYATSTSGTAGTLYTVNLTTGAATVVGSTTGSNSPIWLEIDNNGLAYSADVGTDTFNSINLSTGAATLVGSLGVDISYAQDADFNTSNNKLYMASFGGSGTYNSGIYEVNVTTGAATLVGDTAATEYTMFTIADSLPAAPPIPPTTCGDNFTDSGGTTANYGNSEDITTVIQPQNAGDAVKITFTQVEIETSTGTGTAAGCWDYLSIYNGPTVSSPVLAAVKCGRTGGTPSVASSLLSVGDSFTSTDPSGKLTVRFRSDSSLNYAGWQATVSCAVLAVDEANLNNFSYYPNPTTGILNISSKGRVEAIEVMNVLGQKVLMINPKDNKSEIDMSRLAPGVYLVKATVNGKVITNKVIKK